MWPNSQFPANLVTFTEETLNVKLHFLFSAFWWEWPWDINFHLYLLYIFHTQINRNRKKIYYINHTVFFSIHANVRAQKSFKRTCAVFNQLRYCKVSEEAITRGVGLQLYKKEIATQLFSCEICEIFTNAYL